LREAGAEVMGLLAIFTYGFDVAAENFVRANCTWHTLSNYDALLKIANTSGYIGEGIDIAHLDTIVFTMPISSAKK